MKLLSKDRYKIFHKIGEGGTGVVYKAKDLYLARTVAIKKIRTRLIPHKDNDEMLSEGVKNAARLKHPNIVTIYDFGEIVEGFLTLPLSNSLGSIFIED
jgi:serine/threonine protein kinase